MVVLADQFLLYLKPQLNNKDINMSCGNRTIAARGLATVLTRPDTTISITAPINREVGFVWMDTSSQNPVLKQLVSQNPDVWVLVGMQDSGV